MAHLARFAIAWPKHIIALCLLATAILGVLATGTAERVTQPELIAPGSESERARDLSQQRFGAQTEVPIMLRGSDADVDRNGRELSRRLAATKGIRVLSPWTPGAPKELRPSGRVALVLASADSPGADRFEADARAVERVRRITEDTLPRDVRFYLTGNAEVLSELKDTSLDDVAKGEKLALPLLLAVLLVVFRSPVAALIPAIFGVFTVVAGTGLLRVATEFTPLSISALTLGSMMGIALGVDYSLLILSRFREERMSGTTDPREAAIKAVETAGHTVVSAGFLLAVAMLSALVVTSGNLLTSTALGVMAAALIALAAALLVIPAVIVLTANHIDRWRIGGQERPGGLAAFVARRALRRPLVMTCITAAPLLALAIAGAGLEKGPPGAGHLPENHPAQTDYKLLAKEFGPGWSSPFQVTIVPDVDARVAPGPVERFRHRVADQEGVAAVFSLPSEEGTRIAVIPTGGLKDRVTNRLQDRLGEESAAFAAQTGHRVALGGVGAELHDFDVETSKQLGPLIATLCVVTFLLLTMMLRAPVLALISVLLNVLTVGASFGVLRLLFAGNSPIMGGPGYVEVTTLLASFTIIFALSIDYQVFLLSRMREGLRHTGNPDDAITYGLDRTARVVTGAAAIMVAVFLAFATSQVATVTQFGIGLAAAVIIDATLIRLVLLPCAMKLGGRSTWWAPGQEPGAPPDHEPAASR